MSELTEDDISNICNIGGTTRSIFLNLMDGDLNFIQWYGQIAEYVRDFQKNAEKLVYYNSKNLEKRPVRSISLRQEMSELLDLINERKFYNPVWAEKVHKKIYRISKTFAHAGFKITKNRSYSYLSSIRTDFLDIKDKCVEQNNYNKYQIVRNNYTN